MPINLLFVCTGNTCRSPMAMVMAQSLLNQRYGEGEYRCDSAAFSLNETEVAKHAVVAIQTLNIKPDLEGYQPKELTKDLVEKAQRVFFLSPLQHIAEVQRRFPTHKEKMVAYYRIGDKDTTVDDPYLGTQDTYDTVARKMLDECTPSLIERLKSERLEPESLIPESQKEIKSALRWPSSAATKSAK